MYDLVIVGAGLAGSMVAKYATDKGYDCVVLDDGNDLAASRASSNLSMFSWIKKLGDVGEQGVSNLQKDWPIQTIQFNGGKSPALHLPSEDVLWKNVVFAKVSQIHDGWVKTTEEKSYYGTVVVAAGVWSQKLLEVEGLQAVAGHTLFFEGQWSEPILKLWAPYKHLKIFQYNSDLVLFGDSTAVLQQNYLEDHKLASLMRAKELGLAPPYKLRGVYSGLRPVMKDKNVVCERRGEKLWLLTGGGKMGMTMYAATAKQLVERL